MSKLLQAKATVQVDNERVRVTEWRFAPGAETGEHIHQMDYVVVPSGNGRLKLVSPQGSHIAKGLDGLFRQTDGGTLPADPQAHVISASLESSNVNTSQTLIDMIEASRSWDMQLQLVTSARDLDTSAADLMRLPNS